MSSIYELKRGDRTVFRVVYRVNGKERRKQFRTKRLAKVFQERLSVHVEQEAKALKDQDSWTFAQLADDWLRACERGRDGEPPLEPETIVTYRQHVTGHLLPLISDARVRGIKTSDVRELRDELLDRSSSRATAKKVFKTFRSIIRHGLRVEQIVDEPAPHITIKSNARSNGRIRIHSKDDMRRIVGKACDLAVDHRRDVNRTWSRYSALLLTLVYGGLRLSEVRGLRRDRVDWDKHIVIVDQRADRRGRIGNPKSLKGIRKVFLPQVAIEALHKLRDSHDHDLLFATRTGRPLDPQNIIKRMWYEVQKRAGVQRLNIHSIRHFYASRLIESGANVKEVAAALGHADEAFTLRTYGHLFHDRDNERQRKERAEALTL